MVCIVATTRSIKMNWSNFANDKEGDSTPPRTMIAVPEPLKIPCADNIVEISQN